MAAPASARERVYALWQIQPAAEPAEGERQVGDGELILRQKLLPTGLAELADDVSDSGDRGLIAKAGSQAIEVVAEQGKIYCVLDTYRRKKTGDLVRSDQNLVLCLVDRDENRRFEGAFEMLGSPTGIILGGNVPKTIRSIDVGYRQIDPNLTTGDFWVGVRYEQYFNIYGKRMLLTDFGGRGVSQSLTAFDTFTSKGPYPHSAQVLGAKFTIVAAEPKSVRVKIETMMPPQPFAVVQTTTYSVY